jgi:hypothetical protein
MPSHEIKQLTVSNKKEEGQPAEVDCSCRRPEGFFRLSFLLPKPDRKRARVIRGGVRAANGAEDNRIFDRSLRG